jgi:hypothetical protein
LNNAREDRVRRGQSDERPGMCRHGSLAFEHLVPDRALG